ncbi:hypothetical protein Leryth_010583 [Lithospermum erythrorhizon]|nr:hypothetical protein Leryth_010583 [Lithospermum erythrorhizon]
MMIVSSQSQCFSFLLHPLQISPVNSQQSQLLNHTSLHTKRGLKFDNISRGREVIISRSGSRKEKEMGFLDENGFVEDMDGYLNYLALEYDSVSAVDYLIDGGADSRPQLASFAFSCDQHASFGPDLCMVVHFPVFLPQDLVLPCLPDMIAERRKKIKDGLEDTYGSRKGQSS